MVDEATDTSLKEQVSICLRHVSSDTLGLYETSNSTSKTLIILIKDALCRSGIDLTDCRGQTCDGAANMSGQLSAMQARLTTDYPKAVYIHCFCHSLSASSALALLNVCGLERKYDWF